MLGLGLSLVRPGGGAAVDPYPGLTVYDKFTDTNSVSLDAHVPTKSPASVKWVEQAGAWDIQSNRASVVSLGASPAWAHATIDSGLADCAISCIVNIPDVLSYAGILIRYVSPTSYILVSAQVANFYIIKWNPGLTVLAGGPATMPIANGVDFVLEVILSGNDIIATLDGGHTLTATDALNNTVGAHGLYSELAGVRFDEFQIA